MEKKFDELCLIIRHETNINSLRIHLASLGSLVNYTDQDNNTLLHIAGSHANIPAMILILASNPDITLKNCDDLSPLDLLNLNLPEDSIFAPIDLLNILLKEAICLGNLKLTQDILNVSQTFGIDAGHTDLLKYLLLFIRAVGDVSVLDREEFRELISSSRFNRDCYFQILNHFAEHSRLILSFVNNHVFFEEYVDRQSDSTDILRNLLLFSLKNQVLSVADKIKIVHYLSKYLDEEDQYCGLRPSPKLEKILIKDLCLPNEPILDLIEETENFSILEAVLVHFPNLINKSFKNMDTHQLLVEAVKLNRPLTCQYLLKNSRIAAKDKLNAARTIIELNRDSQAWYDLFSNEIDEINSSSIIINEQPPEKKKKMEEV